MTIQEAFRRLIHRLTGVYDRREASNIARIVFEDAFGIRHMSPSMAFRDLPALEGMLDRLLRQEPVQYVVGETQFYGLKLKVTEDVLIPRPETEELVHWILQEYRGKSQKLRILDIGTGSGCIALALAAHLSGSEVLAMDVSEKALAVATGNAQALSLSVEFLHDSILKPQGKRPSFDLLVSNPPYIPPSQQDKMRKQVLAYEPELALFTREEDPLQFYKAILNYAEEGGLSSGGSIFLEINEFLAEEAADLFRDAGWDLSLKRDMQGKWRMLRAYRA